MDVKENNNEVKEAENDLYLNTMNQYIIEEKLGEGMFGMVKLGTHKITKEKVAIKILNKSKISKSQQILLNRELSILKKMNHYNIIKLYSIIETEKVIYLIQEYCSGKELSNYILYHSRTDEKEICRIFQEIISGVEYMHKMGIAHRDLKPENILLTGTNDIKIIDFGLSNIYSKGKLLSTSCGSPYYAPPEMLQGKAYKGLPADLYSCGIILYYMLCKKLPFNESNNSELYKKKIEGKFNISKHLSKEAQDLLKKIIKVNPEQRIKIADLKKHPWFKLANINYNMHSGLNPKEIVFPIDEEIINNMSELGFNKMEVRYNIIKNEHNNITTSYYLLLNKKLRVGRKSIADLHSNLYDDYINDPKNKMGNYKEGIEEAIKERIYSKGCLEIIPDFEECRLQKKRPSIKLKRNSILKIRKSISSSKENRDSISNINIKIDILNKPKINSNSVAKNRKRVNNIHQIKKERNTRSAKMRINKKIFGPKIEFKKKFENKYNIRNNINAIKTIKNEQNRNIKVDDDLQINKTEVIIEDKDNFEQKNFRNEEIKLENEPEEKKVEVASPTQPKNIVNNSNKLDMKSPQKINSIKIKTYKNPIKKNLPFQKFEQRAKSITARKKKEKKIITLAGNGKLNNASSAFEIKMKNLNLSNKKKFSNSKERKKLNSSAIYSSTRKDRFKIKK